MLFEEEIIFSFYSLHSMYLKLEIIEAAAKLQASVTNKFAYYLSSVKENV